MSNAKFVAGGMVMVTLLAAGCGTHAETTPPLANRINAAIVRGTDFLHSRQGSDGLWRSDVYGSFKDPSVLTPFVLSAIDAASPGPAIDQRGLNFLIAMTRADGSLDTGGLGCSYPIYTGAFTVGLLKSSRQTVHMRARTAWANDLASRQLDEKLGWQPQDPDYGGWGYAKELPRKPGAGLQVLPGTESNLSATTFALEALGHIETAPEVFRKAARFLERCQNFSKEAVNPPSPQDDGGFFFIPTDPSRNKAGFAGKDATGRLRYASYGSATADGIRALRACGVLETDPRLQAARSWLARSFRANTHPGDYASDRAMNREALYYYYAFSVSHALRDDGDDLRRREQLAEALLARQRPDGSWVNPAVAVREDDPLVATPFAVLALAACRDRH
jgi:hypothetical protein